jgi:hypothetical protein
MAVHKKKEIKSEEKPTETNTEEVKAASGEPKTEPMIVSDVITETIEVIETAVPQASEEMPLTSSSQTDPLSDFKEKVKEGLNMPDRPQKNYMWPVLFIFLIAIVLMAGVFAYKRGAFKGVKLNVASLTPTPTASPEPTKAVVIDLAKYEIEILNGSGIDGEASRQKTSLEAAGFTVSSVGNADNSDYTDTILEAKSDVDADFIAKLKSTLSDTFTAVSTQTLSSDFAVPVEVILGTKK